MISSVAHRRRRSDVRGGIDFTCQDPVMLVTDLRCGGGSRCGAVACGARHASVLYRASQLRRRSWAGTVLQEVSVVTLPAQLMHQVHRVYSANWRCSNIGRVALHKVTTVSLALAAKYIPLHERNVLSALTTPGEFYDTVLVKTRERESNIIEKKRFSWRFNN